MVFEEKWWRWLCRWWSWSCCHDVPEKYINDNDTNGSNENDDGYDVGIDDDDDGSHWC